MNNCIIVKVGTELLLNNDGSLNNDMMNHIIDGLFFLQSKGKNPILVSSGAVGVGRNFLKNKKISKGTYAAIGQPMLMNSYSAKAKKYDLITSQYLITRDDIADRKRFICLQSSLEEALRNSLIPIINDNDVLHESRESFSDNDQLACYLSVMLEAEKVLILTSVNGIYKNFGKETEEKIDVFTTEKDLDAIDTDGGHSKTESGTGGMKGKITSIKFPMKSGIDVYVGHGKDKNIFSDIFKEKGEYTKVCGLSGIKKMKGMQKWLFVGAEPKGEIQISDMGAEILKNKKQRKSVLIKGVEKVIGRFDAGDVVQVSDSLGKKIGYGVVKLNSKEIEEHKGKDDIIVIHANYFLVK